MTPAKKLQLSSRFVLRLPATSANLGPAFDAAAIALDLYISIEAKTAAAFSIVATGRDREICQRIENHLILTTYQEVAEANGWEVIPLSLKIKNDIPIGKGCGSSAAARLAGIALANHFGRLHWSDAQIVSEAARREHHADNAAACWMGGLAVASMSDVGKIQMAQVPIKGKWPLFLAVPGYPLSTEEARRVLPPQYSRADAVTNVQNAMLLLTALTQGRNDLLASALDDRIHQPYRAPLCPLLPCLWKLRGRPGVLGVVLSGAGPSVLVFLDPRVSIQPTRKMLTSHIAAAGVPAELLVTRITQRGGRG